MRHAQVALTDSHGFTVWQGSLHRFLRANSMRGEEARDVVQQLRAGLKSPHAEPVMFGGGAAPSFLLTLA